VSLLSHQIIPSFSTFQDMPNRVPHPFPKKHQELKIFNYLLRKYLKFVFLYLSSPAVWFAPPKIRTRKGSDESLIHNLRFKNYFAKIKHLIKFMLILMSCICRVLGTQGEPRMSAMCASVAFRTSFKQKKNNRFKSYRFLKKIVHDYNYKLLFTVFQSSSSSPVKLIHR
jgi:hypothetical protein